MKTNIALREFLDGESLRYPGFDFKATMATYRVGVGIFVERRGVDLGTAAVVTDKEARRFYHNATRIQ